MLAVGVCNKWKILTYSVQHNFVPKEESKLRCSKAGQTDTCILLSMCFVTANVFSSVKRFPHVFQNVFKNVSPNVFSLSQTVSISSLTCVSVSCLTERQFLSSFQICLVLQFANTIIPQNLI